MTHLPIDVGSYRVSPDVRRLVVSVAVLAAASCDEIACTNSDGRPRGRQGHRQVFDKLFHPPLDEWGNGTRNTCSRWRST